MKRDVKCHVILEFTGLLEILNDSHCNETKPNVTQVSTRAMSYYVGKLLNE